MHRLDEHLNIAFNTGIGWLKKIIKQPNNAEWFGHMNSQSRDIGSVCPATKYVYGPFIDSPPTHPETILTSLEYINKPVQSYNQPHVYITADLQLFKIILQIKWNEPLRWKELIVFPGGMHLLQSFIGCIGTRMTGNGLEQLLGVAFDGVPNMLSGKAWPKALRGLRMVVTVLLESYITSNTECSSYDLQNFLEKSRSTKLGRLWIDNLIIPVYIAHLFVRGERGGNSVVVVRIYYLKRMLPYFFSAGHWNYARYIIWHIQEYLNDFDDKAVEFFFNNHHVCRHKAGCWNGIN